MPQGRVQIVDEQNRRARIVWRGRVYEADLSEVASPARVPGVRVRFDVVRADGVERARAVQLAVGARNHPRQRRFGDLTGARRDGAKVPTTAKQYGVDVTTQPTRVAQVWADLVLDGAVDAALALYDPGAVLHTADGTTQGRARLGRFLEDLAVEVRGVGAAPSFVTNDRYVQVSWVAEAAEPLTTTLSVVAGSIARQWFRVDDGEPDGDEAGRPLEIVRRGPVTDSDVDYAESKLSQVEAGFDETIRLARVKLEQSTRAAHDRPASVELALDVDGDLVRAHHAAATMTEAVDAAAARLRDRMNHRRDRHRHDATGTEARPNQWRHGQLPPTRPAYYDRPREDRELVRHKTLATPDATPEEAAWDMDQLDYDFFLFRELGSGQDSLLARRPDGGLRAAQVEPEDDLAAWAGVTDDVDRAPAPRLAVSDAIERLDAGDEPFVFFLNHDTGRGNVVYRRYDGHYGLITPVDET